MEVGHSEWQVGWWLILFLADIFKVIININNFEHKFVFLKFVILQKKVILSSKSGQFFGIAKHKKSKCFDLFHQSLNSCGLLLEIDLFN